MTDRILVTTDRWALGTDGIQWMLMRRHARKGRHDTWDPIWFVRSHRDILARGMRDNGVGDGTARLLLAGLPDTFDEWKTSQPSP
jgi:hypothetical protein